MGGLRGLGFIAGLLSLGFALACSGVLPAGDGLLTSGDDLGIDIGCPVLIWERSSGAHDELPAIYKAAEAATSEALYAQICDPQRSRLELAVATERLGLRWAREQGREAEGFDLLHLSAVYLANPTALLRLSLLYARGTQVGQRDIAPDLPKAARFYSAGSVIINDVGTTFGRPPASTWATPAAGAAMIVPDLIRATPEPPQLELDAALERYRSLYPK